MDNTGCIYNQNENIELIMTRKETVFEIAVLKEYDKQLVRNATTFSGFTDVYNVDRELVYNRKLNIKRFEEAWFTWKLRVWIFKTNYVNANQAAMFDSKDIENEIKRWFPRLHETFINIWSHVHQNCSSHCKTFRWNVFSH
jgi:hypothetical protein